MDFFATGGFQQLFHELNEEFDTINDITDFTILADVEHDFNQEKNYEIDPYLSNFLEDTLDEDNQNCNNKIFLDLNEVHKGDDNWLNNIKLTDYFDNEPEHTLNAHELAEWEDKFLDNYIEIPELVDILPEKTALCTNTCDLFLHESTRNLKLNRHEKTHTRTQNDSEKGYICTFNNCCKIYAKPAHLKAHMRRHLGEKPYVCSWPNCTWKFSRSDELARHKRSHSGVKPYKCIYCAKCFARSDHLTKHRKVHERRLLAASKAGILPQSVFSVRPGRRRKNTL